MIAPLARWKAAVACGAGIAAAVVLLLLQHERHARVEAERGRAEAQAQVVAARAQAELDQAAGAAAAAAQGRTLHIDSRSEEAAHAILDLPGADQALPQAVRDGWTAGVRGLRDAPSGSGDADPAGG